MRRVDDPLRGSFAHTSIGRGEKDRVAAKESPLFTENSRGCAIFAHFDVKPSPGRLAAGSGPPGPGRQGRTAPRQHTVIIASSLGPAAF